MCYLISPKNEDGLSHAANKGDTVNNRSIYIEMLMYPYHLTVEFVKVKSKDEHSYELIVFL